MTTPYQDDGAALIDSIEFADNKEPRCACVLLIDVSGSMKGERIAAVNRALLNFEQDIKNDTLKALRTELAVISFNHETTLVQDFISGYEFSAPTLVADGGTMMAPAICTALDLCEARKETYRRNGIAYFRSLILLLTDGRPEHDKPYDLDVARDRLREAEQESKVGLFPFGINDSRNGSGVDFPALNRIVKRPVKELTSVTQIGGVMEWLSNSMSAVSDSQPGDRVRLADPDEYTDKWKDEWQDF